MTIDKGVAPTEVIVIHIPVIDGGKKERVDFFGRCQRLRRLPRPVFWANVAVANIALVKTQHLTGHQ